MLFLIEYNRREGRLVALRQYPSEQRRDAEDARLKLELELNANGLQHEVVILEAADESVIRRTHRRYFESLEQISAEFIRAVHERDALGRGNGPRLT